MVKKSYSDEYATAEEFPYPASQPSTPSSGPEKLFDVTCIVGSIYRGGQYTAKVAAFMLIAEHGADGEFTFPDEDGSVIHVGVYTNIAKTK